MKKVTIVIPNYNGLKFMEPCMAALDKQLCRDFELLVVDNGSTDGSVEWLKEHGLPSLFLETNTGFSGAVNVGIKAYQRGVGQEIERYDRPCHIFSACAGAAIYRREVFEEIGYFDEMHFAYLEDIDVGYRAKIAGYYNLYCPSAKVFHVGSGTSGSKYNSFKVKLAARNNVYLNYKNMPAPQLLVNSIPIAAGIAGKYCFFKKLGFEKDYVAGVLEGIKTVKKTRKVPYRKEDFHNYLAIEWELIYGAALYIYEFSRRQIRKKMAGPAKS